MAETRYIAIDLGAESGRVMLGTLRENSHSSPPELQLEEWHRFQNVPVEMAGAIRWNIPQLWADIQTGLAKAAAAAKSAGSPVHGVSADSWGVDYVLLGKGSPMLAPPPIYRDPRTQPSFDKAMKDLGAEFIFANTGIQIMSINTLFQLLAEPRELLEVADAFLNIGDYFNYLLAGCPRRPTAEISLASTSQVFDVALGRWSDALIQRVGFPRRIFPNVTKSGTPIGKTPLLETAQVIAGCSHDTACAVAAVPAEGEPDWAYISSGTWSLAGVELAKPIVTDRCRELGFTNELGHAGTTRLLKNISGLYMLQQCRAEWGAGDKAISYAHLASMGEKARPLRSLIRPEYPAFSSPGGMCGKISEYCRKTGQTPPTEVGQFVRCIYESLSLLYRKTMLELTELTARPLRRLHIVGGGSRASLLNQLTADACAIPVFAGPVEATSMGNVLIQAAALGHISPPDIRTITRAASSLQTFEPHESGRMDEAYGKFLQLPVA